MSDTPRTYDWLGPARDSLKEVGLDDAADALARLPTVEERLERAVVMLERFVSLEIIDRDDARPDHAGFAPELRMIAEHRGETIEATFERLRPERQPADRVTTEVGPSGQSMMMTFSIPANATYEIYDGNRRIGTTRIPG